MDGQEVTVTAKGFDAEPRIVGKQQHRFGEHRLRRQAGPRVSFQYDSGTWATCYAERAIPNGAPRN
ncbi:hypothetical protein ACVCAH_24845 [Micromonospora sp. LZ34]